MEVEVRVALQVEVNPWSAKFDKGSGLELEGVGEIENGVIVVLQPQMGEGSGLS